MAGKEPGKEKKAHTCRYGHQFLKSSDCPVCPVCEKKKADKTGIFSSCSAPARRALESRKINSLNKLSGYREAEILSWHGIGPASLPALKKMLLLAGLRFKK